MLNQINQNIYVRTEYIEAHHKLRAQENQIKTNRQITHDIKPHATDNN